MSYNGKPAAASVERIRGDFEKVEHGRGTMIVNVQVL